MKLSRTAAFHSASLVLTGSVLLALGSAGEVFRHFGGEWGWLAEVSLAFAVLIALALLLTSGSARSRFQHLVVDHIVAMPAPGVEEVRADAGASIEQATGRREALRSGADRRRTFLCERQAHSAASRSGAASLMLAPKPASASIRAKR